MPRPSVTAETLASLAALVPPRIAKRLDANPRAADAWTETPGEGSHVIRTDGEEQITLTGHVISSLDQIHCSCLLSPRCFHALAVLSVLPLAEQAAATAAMASPADTATQGDVSLTSLDGAQVAAARRGLAVAQQIIAGGLVNVSTARLGELLRAVHEARRQSLPRLEATLLAVVDEVRRLRQQSPDFVLTDAADALARLWLTATLLARGETHHAGISLVGTARRGYAERRGLRITGLGTEPILAAGYAGVVSRFTNGREVFSAVELWPGDNDRATAAVSAQLRFGEISLAHRDTLTSTLLFAVARVSPDGRLGAGQDVTAARAPLDEAPRDLYLASARDGHIDKLVAYHPLATNDGDELLVVAGRFVTREGGGSAVLLSNGGLATTLPAIDHPRFAFRENLTLLARAEAEAQIVCKVRFEGALLRLCPLTVFPLPGAARSVTEAFDLGFERKARADLPAGDPSSSGYASSAPSPDPLTALRSRVLRWALGGKATLPTAALPIVARETEALRRSLLPTLAAVSTRLATTASERDVASSSEAWASALFALRGTERMLARTELQAGASGLALPD